MIVGILHFFKKIHEDLYQRAVGIEPALGKVYQACGKWLERDDH